MALLALQLRPGLSLWWATALLTSSATVDAALLVAGSARTRLADSRHRQASRAAVVAESHLLVNLSRPTIAGPPDCTKHPVLCSNLLKCDTEPARRDINERIATDEGHANLKSWCYEFSFPYVDDIVQDCLLNKADLRRSAKALYRRQVREGNGDLLGSYCFLEKHCSNTEVTTKTTVSEAERMCDKRFGHDVWTNFGLQEMSMQRWWLLTGKMNRTSGFHSRKPTQAFSKMFCAMGNYHCDINYCKETYCKKPYYVKKYGHLLSAEPVPGDPRH